MRMWALVQAQATEFRRNATLMMMPLIVVFLAFIWSLMGEKGEMLHFFVSASLLMCCYMVGCQLPSMTLSEEREKRTLEAVFLTPVRPMEVIGARVIFAVIVTALTAVACLAVYKYVPSNPWMLLLSFGLALLLTVAIGVTVGLVASDQKSAGVITAPIMVTLMLGGIMPWEKVAPGFWEVQRWLPTRPLMELMMTGVTGQESPVLRNTLVMLPYIGAMLWLCARTIRKSASSR